MIRKLVMIIAKLTAVKDILLAELAIIASAFCHSHVQRQQMVCCQLFHFMW
jgi:hypothetical protein